MFQHIPAMYRLVSDSLSALLTDTKTATTTFKCFGAVNNFMKFTTAALDSGYVSLILVVPLVGPLLLTRSWLASVCVCLWSYICANVIRLIRLPLLQIYVLCFILSLTISFGFLFPFSYSSFLYF